MVLRLFRVLYWLGFIFPILMVVIVILAAILTGDVWVPISLFLCALCGHAMLIAVHYIIRAQFAFFPWQLK